MTVATQPAAAAVPDYFAFEARMRGSTAAVRERQRPYVDDFRDAGPVLDIGCGRGEFLRCSARGGRRSARDRRRRGHGRVRAGEGSTWSRRMPLPISRLSRTARSAASSPRRSSSTCPRDAGQAARARRSEASSRRPVRRRDDQPALAARSAQLLRRPHARAAARAGDAGAAGGAGGLPRGRDALSQRARGEARGARRPGRSRRTSAG